MLKRLDPPTDVEDAHAPVALEPPEEFDPREALNFIWRRWKLVVGVTALALLIGALDLERQTPIYAASAELLLEPGKDRTATQQADHSTGEVPTPRRSKARSRSSSRPPCCGALS